MLSACLVAEAELRTIERLAPELEGLHCIAFYLECRLGSGTPQLDLLVQLRPSATACSAWWTAHRTAMSASSLWTEYDGGSIAGTAGTAIEPPGLHLRIDATGGESASFDRARTRAALEALRDDGILTPDVCAWMKACVDALPEGGRAIHASFMPSREPREWKLYVSLPACELARYFSGIGWREHWGGVQAQLARFCRAELTGGVVYCDLTFRPALAPSFGLVYSQAHVRAGACDPARTRPCRELVAAGLCTEEQCDALARWMAPRRRGLIQQGVGRELERCLDLKVRFRPETGLEAKAYLGFQALGSVC